MDGEAIKRKAYFMWYTLGILALLFIVGALRQLLADENFTNLLRAEGMDSLPQYLADRVWARGCGT